jgi:hypothetical protein
MKKNNMLLGVIGGILTMAFASGLAIGGYYLFAIISFILGIAIIDYNQRNNH